VTAGCWTESKAARRRPAMENRRRILVVDDEPEFAGGLQAALERESYEVVVAGSRPLAEESVRARKPDAVLLGTIAPRGDAFRLHKWLRQTPELGHVPVIVIDAPEGERALKGWRRDEGMRMEAEDYVAKPVEAESLMATLDGALHTLPLRVRVPATLDHALFFGSMGQEAVKAEGAAKSRLMEEIEEILRRVTTPEDLAEIERAIMEAKGKVRLEAATGFWEGKSPCWELTHCEAGIRNECPAYAEQALACWKTPGTYCQLEAFDGIGDETSICRVCRVYRKYGAGEPLPAQPLEGLVDTWAKSNEPFSANF
jgi:two-component system alkaline phosphatase synthesis response regulator PhoP